MRRMDQMVRFPATTQTLDFMLSWLDSLVVQDPTKLAALHTSFLLTLLLAYAENSLPVNKY